MPAASTTYRIVRLLAGLALMTTGGAGMYASVITLKPVGLEFEVSRGLASLPYALNMIGFGFGGVLMGRLSDRYGVMKPALGGGLILAAGFALAAVASEFWQFCLIQCVMIGLLGSAASFAPVVADISHWFNRRRGIAIGIVSSGSYTAGAIWAPAIQAMVDADGWREAYLGLALFCGIAMPLLALLLYRKAPASTIEETQNGPAIARPIGMKPNTLQVCICAAGIGCCVAMAMPQVHLVAYVTDLGHAARHGAAMLAVMLVCGVISRLGSGLISDHVGGLNTLLLGSGLQMLALIIYMPTDSLLGLYIVSALFGLSQGGIVPSYAMIIRSFFRPSEAGWRIGAAFQFTLFGMALGGWMAGALYDLTASYNAPFINAIAFNKLHLALAGVLKHRSRAVIA